MWTSNQLKRMSLAPTRFRVEPLLLGAVTANRNLVRSFGSVSIICQLVRSNREVGDLDSPSLATHADEHERAEDRIDQMKRSNLGSAVKEQVVEVAEADERRSQRARPEVPLRWPSLRGSFRAVLRRDLVGDESGNPYSGRHSAAANA